MFLFGFADFVLDDVVFVGSSSFVLVLSMFPMIRMYEIIHPVFLVQELLLLRLLHTLLKPF